MPEEDINMKKAISRILKLLFILTICTVTFYADSDSIEKQYVQPIENAELSFVETECLQQNSRISWSTKRRASISSLNLAIRYIHTPILYSWYCIKHNEYSNYSYTLPFNKEIIHFYCVLQI